MAIPEPIRRQAELLLFALCGSHVPVGGENYRLAFRIRMNSATIYKVHGPWNPKFPKSSRRPVAQFRYDPELALWTLYRADEKERWHTCDYAQPTSDLLSLVTTVDVDPAGEFFA